MLGFWAKLVLVVTDFVKATCAAAGILTAGWISTSEWHPILLFAQTLPTPGSLESLVDYAMKQGGAFIVLLVVLFYYRRDYQRLTTALEAREVILMDVVKENAAALATFNAHADKLAPALNASNMIISELKGFLSRSPEHRTPRE